MTPEEPPFAGAAGGQPSEEEMRVAYEAELKRVRVEDVLVQTVVSLVNLGGRKAGLAPGTEDERDLEQVRQAVEGAKALLPLVEPSLGQEAGQVREAISQLQMAYARGRQADPGTGTPVPGPEPAGDGEQEREDPQSQEHRPGPAQSSGRLWVPGQ